MSFVVGIAVCAAAVVFMLKGGGNPAILLDWKTAAAVIAGTLGVMMAANPFRAIRDNISLAFSLACARNRSSEISGEAMELVKLARKDGVLSLEDRVGKIKDDVLKKGVELIAASAGRETVQSVLSEELRLNEAEEKSAFKFIEKLSVISPGVGIVAAIAEFVEVLFVYKGPQSFAVGASYALLPVVYGFVFSYFIFMPFASRVRAGSEKRKAERSLAVMGVMAIQAGEPPFIAQERLDFFAEGVSSRGRGE